MKHLFSRTCPSLTSLLITTGVFIFASGIWQNINAQSPNSTPVPFEVSRDVTVDFILATLNRDVGTIDQRNTVLIKRVKKDSIKFVMTSDEEQQFTKAGATPALIDTIKTESEKLEKTPFGNVYLGSKYLNAGKKARLLEEDFTSKTKRARMMKNEEEAKKNEEEAKKNNDEAMSNLEKAIPYLNKALETDPTNVFALNNLGVAYENMKKYDDAISYFSKVIDVEPAISRYVNRATVFEKKGLATENKDDRRAAFDKANEDYGRAMLIDPCYRGAYQRRAENYKFFGLTDKYNADMLEVTQIKEGKKECPK